MGFLLTSQKKERKKNNTSGWALEDENAMGTYHIQLYFPRLEAGMKFKKKYNLQYVTFLAIA